MNACTVRKVCQHLLLAAIPFLFAGPALASNNKTDSSQKEVLALSKRIDEVIGQKLAAEKVTPSQRASDAEFLRRLSLDLNGVIPSAEKAAAFLDSTDPLKRSKLIDELLASPLYGRHQADTWQRLMLPRESVNNRLQPAPFVKWLEENFNANKPWDQLVRDILTSTGPQDKNGATTYFLANQAVDKITDSVSKLFLGVQLQCAQCHNHPFTTYKQDDYWAMAAFFMKVKADNVNRAARDGNAPGLTEAGPARPQRLPESAKRVSAKFLQGEQPKMNASDPFRPVLANWLATSQNKFFARAMVNRTWAQLFARGFVHPVDDMHEGNTPSHPELLNELSTAFAANGFDLKYLLRAICNSEAYQRGSKPASDRPIDERLFASMAVKPLTPEQLYDSLTGILGTAARPARPQKPQAQNRFGSGPREQFVAFFQGDENASPTEYQAGIPQVLRLMNSPQMNTTQAVQAAAKSGMTPNKVVEHLYMTALSRRPTAQEAARLDAYVGQRKSDPRQAYGDILWALLNSSEFALNH